MKSRLPVLIFLVGLIALTALSALAVNRGPFERSPSGTEAIYWDAAQKAARGEIDAGGLSAYPSPLYPRFLGLFAGDGVLAARDARRALTFLLLPLAGLLVYALVRRRAGAWPAAAAGWIAVLSAPIVLSAGSFSPSMPAAALCALALVTLDGKRSPLVWAVAGLLVGLSGQFNGTLAWVVGILVAVMALVRPRDKGRQGWALSLAAFAFLWLAASWGGSAIAGSRSPLPVVSGVDVYRGHRALASGVEPRRGDADARRWWVHRDFTREASLLSQKRMTSAQASAFWARRAAGEALRHPVAELRRTGVKALASFQGDPLPRDVGPAFLLQRGDTGALPVSIWLGRIALPLGLAGLLLARRRAGWILWIAALSGLGAALAAYAEADARDLSLIGLAGGLALFIRALAEARGPGILRAALAGVLAVALFGLLPAFGGVPGQGVLGDDYFHMGGVYDQEKRGSAALREYERALRLEPDNPYPRYAIAGMLARDGVLEEATRELEALRESGAAFPPGLQMLARLYERQQRWAEASAVYGELVNLDPFNTEYLNNLGAVYVQVGYFDQAVQAFESALAVDPGHVAAKSNLAGLRERGLAPAQGEITDPLRLAQEQVLTFMRAGDTAAADSALQAAYERFGDSVPELKFLDGTVRLVTGRAAEAVPLLESIKASFDKDVIFLNNLAAAYAQSGKRTEAAATWEEALAMQPANERIRRSLVRVRAEMDSLARVGAGG